MNGIPKKVWLVDMYEGGWATSFEHGDQEYVHKSELDAAVAETWKKAIKVVKETGTTRWVRLQGEEEDSASNFQREVTEALEAAAKKE